LGFDDTRGTLFFNVCQIIQEKKPKVVVLENVKHLIHHDKKRTLTVILNSLKELGYNVSYQVLNSKDFGLPQNRERIFIIGCKNSFFDFNKLQKSPTPQLENFLDKKNSFEFLDKSEYTLIDNPKKQPTGLIFVGYRNKNQWKKGVRPNTSHLSRVHRQPNRIYSVEGVHPTIPSQETSGRFFIYLPKMDMVRKLTLNECYRIMGFPSNFKRHSRTGEQYKQIGNSVAVSVIDAIAKQILEQNLLHDEPQTEIIGNLRALLHNN
jgi:DNA (cytosine-5)-methyltransferase 1